MAIYCSNTNPGFYDTDAFPIERLPADAFEITREKYDELFEGQRQGMMIDFSQGEPFLRAYEVTEEMVRDLRDALLKETDWTQAPDVPEATRLKWQTYRQLLRDVPQQTGFPTNVVWPAKP